MKRMKHVISIILGVCFPLAGQAQADTVRAYALPEVTVTDSHRIREVRSVAPVQSLSREELEHQHALQLSDAVKRFSGVTVKDYGGVGGLKTASVRSLGAQHTVIGYDGIAITDCQTGQIDLGRFSLENVGRVALSNGQDDNIFQPARFFASAGVLHIETLAPEFEAEERTHLRAKVKAGSWGLANPSLRIERKAGRKWALTGDAEWMSSDGRYPFTLYYGDENDASSREKRQNTEVRALRAEAGLYGTFSIREQWRLKAYYYQSSRGLPAAATYYSRTLSCKAITGKSSAGVSLFGLPGNGTGATSVTSTPIIRAAWGRRRTTITSKSIIFRLRRFGGRWIIFRSRWQWTEA